MTLKKILLGFIFAFVVSAPTLADDHVVAPWYKSDNAEVSAFGYSNMTVGTEKDFMANQIRERITGKYKNFTAFAEFDVAGLLDDRIAKPNYITQAWVGYNFGKEPLFGNMFSNTIIRAGSFLTAGGTPFYTAYQSIPIIDPYTPFAYYANGVQFQTDVTKNITITADVTGTSGLPITDNQRTGRTETSQRLDWNAIRNKDGKTTLQLSLMNAWSDEFERTALRFKWSPIDRLDLYGNVFRANEQPIAKKATHETGGFAMVDYTLWKMGGNKLDLKVLGMFEKRSGTINYTGYTGGVTLELPENGGYGRLGGSSVTADFTSGTTSIGNGPAIDDDSAMIRFRILF